jgi:adenylate cyclase
MQLRIGVNLGDIVHEGEHVYGDGINVAARLEPLAQPGGICISATVRDAIIGNLALPLEDLGEKSLKNIERPVRIYEIPPPGARARNSRIGAGLKGLRRATPLLAIVVVLLIAGVEAWRLWPSQRQALEYAPAIAVLPFVNAQRDANLDYLGPSLAREVSAGSQHFRCCASSRPQAFRRRNSQIRSGLRRSLGRIMRWRAAF